MFSVHLTYSTPHSCIEGRASDFMVSDCRRYLCCVLQCAHSVKGGVELHASTGVCACGCCACPAVAVSACSDVNYDGGDYDSWGAYSQSKAGAFPLPRWGS